ncbi:MAG: sulfatase [Planctomycetota bacterium]
MQGVVLAAAVITLTITDASAADAERPNVVMIVVDDLGWSDVGCYGNTFHETPHIDALAASGARFTDAYAASPVCSPTRAALMTGRDPVAVNITDWIKGWRPNRIKPPPQLRMPNDLDNLPLAEVTLAEVLRDRGYQTAFVGKWHLGYSGFYPEQQGFDVNHGGHDKGSPPGGYQAPWTNPTLPNRDGDAYLTTRLTDEVVSFIENRDAARPFFVCLSYYNVHTPIEAHEPAATAFRQKASRLAGAASDPAINPDYASMVHAVDTSVGRLMTALQRAGLASNTIVVFTSDNGGLESVRDQTPLRAGKALLYEGGIRVPLIFHGPGVQRGTVSSTPSISMDVPVTLLDLTALPGDRFPATFAHGVSLAPVLAGDPQPHREPGSTGEADQTQPTAADRPLHWHYPHYHIEGWRTGGAIRQGRWKLIEFFESGRVELYDLETDIGESFDLAQERPETRDRLRRSLRQWRNSINAKMPWK